VRQSSEASAAYAARARNEAASRSRCEEALAESRRQAALAARRCVSFAGLEREFARLSSVFQ
jgi:hypothetical protein